MRSAQLSRAKQCAMVLLLAMALTGVFLWAHAFHVC